MKATLSGMDLKLARAASHLKTLEQARGDYSKRTPFSVEGHTDPATGDYVFQVAGDPPALDWGLTVGDFAHTLRSSLDNLLWQVVLLRGGTPTKATQFPIFETNAKPPETQRTIDRRTQGVSRADRGYIELVQPYHVQPLQNAARPRSIWHPLALLAELNNMDKHRVIPTCVAATVAGIFDDNVTQVAFINARDRLQPVEPTTAVSLTDPTGKSIPLMRSFGLPVVFLYSDGAAVVHQGTSFIADDEHRMELLRVLKPDRPGSHMQYTQPVLAEISFSGRERPMHIGDLSDILRTVVEIVEHFRPEFGA